MRVRLRRGAAVLALVIATGAACSNGSPSTVRAIRLSGSSGSGAFAVIVTYPKSARSGSTVQISVTLRSVRGHPGGFTFDLAFDGDPTCQIHNVVSWSAVRRDLRPGETSAVKDRQPTPSTTTTTAEPPRLWPRTGFNLQSGASEILNRHAVSIPHTCSGRLAFVAVARPRGGGPIMRRFHINVT